MRKTAIGILTGLASLVSACHPFGVGINLIPAHIYDFKIVKEGDICEEDAKPGEVKIAEWRLSEDAIDFIQTNGIGAEVEGHHNAQNPFFPVLRGEDSDGNGSIDKWALFIRDNGNQLAVGEFKNYNVQVRSSSNVVWDAPLGGIPPYSFPFISFTGNGFDAQVRYGNCVPDEQELPYVVGDGICDSANRENVGNSPSDCFVPPTGPPYTVGDGFCDITHGENTSNSPVDCPAPPTGPTELEQLVGWACTNLPRATVDNPLTVPRDERIDTRVYWVTPTGGGNFSYIENLEISPSNPLSNGGIVKHIVNAGSTGGKYLVATAGTFNDPVGAMTSGLAGHNPEDCRHIYVFNPEVQDMPNTVFGSTVVRQTGVQYAEQLRGIVP